MHVAWNHNLVVLVVVRLHDHVDLVGGRGHWRYRCRGRCEFGRRSRPTRRWSWSILGHGRLLGGHLIRVFIGQDTTGNGLAPLAGGQAADLMRSVRNESGWTQNFGPRSERGAVRREDLGVVHVRGQGIAFDQLATRRWPIPALVNVAGEHGAAQHLVAVVAVVNDGAQVAYGAVDQLVGAVRNGGGQTALDELADGRELVVEARLQARPGRGSHQQVALIAIVLHRSAHVKALGRDHC